MNIREANVNDIQALAELATRTYKDAFGPTFTAEELTKRVEETRSVRYFSDAFKKDVVLLAEEANQLVGYLEFGPVDLPIETTDGDQELSRLYVLKQYQRRGIGKLLMETALAHPMLRKTRTVWLDVWEKNEGAVRLYESYGFENTGKIIDGDIIMLKRNLLA